MAHDCYRFIPAYEEAIERTLSLTELRQDLEGAQPEVSFWRSRLIRYGNGTTVALATVTAKFLSLSHLNDCDDISMENRLAGLEVFEKLRKFYHDTDRLIGTIGALAECLTGKNGTEIYGPRWRIDDWEVSARLRSFTKEQFKEKFPGYSCDDKETYAYEAAYLGGESLYIAPSGPLAPSDPTSIFCRSDFQAEVSGEDRAQT